MRRRFFNSVISNTVYRAYTIYQYKIVRFILPLPAPSPREGYNRWTILYLTLVLILGVKKINSEKIMPEKFRVNSSLLLIKNIIAL